MNGLRTTIVLATFAMLIALVGCSNDKGTEPISKMVGDTGATEYQAAEAVFSEATDLGNDGLGEALNMAGEIANSQQGVSLGRLSTRAANAVAADTLEYHFASNYWYRVHSQVDTQYVEGTDSLKAIISWYVRDSLQFRHGMDPVVLPDSALLTELRFGRIAEGWNQTDADSLSVTQTTNMVGEPGQIAAQGDVVVNSDAHVHGTAQEHVDHLETGYECTFGFNLVGAWNDIALNLHSVWELNDCPTSGSLVQAGTLSADCLSDSSSVQFNGHWMGSLTFNNGTQTAVFENETTRWTETSECGPDQPLAVKFK